MTWVPDEDGWMSSEEIHEALELDRDLPRCEAMLGSLRCELTAGHDRNHLAHEDNPLGEEIVEWRG